jgi:hypothetical protein
MPFICCHVPSFMLYELQIFSGIRKEILEGAERLWRNVFTNDMKYKALVR